MSYDINTAIFQHNETISSNRLLLEQMEMEADMLLNRTQSLQYVYEAINGQNTKNNKSVIGKFIDFLTQLFTKFSEKVQELVRNDEKWLRENKESLVNANYNDLSIDMLPFKKFDSKTIEGLLRPILSASAGANFTKMYADKEDLIKKYFSNLLDESGDLADGAKNFFRVGNARGPIKHVKYEGGALKEKVLEMHAYCSSYESTTLSGLKKEVDDLGKMLNQISNSLVVRGVKESSFTIEEGLMFNNYVYRDILMEEAKPEEKKEPEKDDNKTESPTKVTVEDKSKEDDTNKKEDGDELKDISSEQLLVMRNVSSIAQTLFAASITVAEEKYKAYMNAMVQLERIISKDSKIKNTDVGVTVKQSKQQPKQEEQKNNKKK